MISKIITYIISCIDDVHWDIVYHNDNTTKTNWNKGRKMKSNGLTDKDV